LSPYYNQNYTKEDIDRIIGTIRHCLKNNRYIVSLNKNRPENLKFVKTYGLGKDERKNALMQIQTEDFCHTLNNIKPGYEHEILYVFVHQFKLFEKIGEKEKIVDVYVKFNIIDLQGEKEFVAISFHRLNKKVDYLFR